MNNKSAINIILALLAAIVGVIGYKLSARLHAKTDVTLPVSACNPALDDCRVALPNGGEIELSFAPRPVRPLQAFTARLKIRGVDVRSAELDFDGTEMKMGYYRPRFTSGDGVYKTEAMLPVCVTRTMKWAATVLLTTPGGSTAIPFHFEVSGR